MNFPWHRTAPLPAIALALLVVGAPACLAPGWGNSTGGGGDVVDERSSARGDGRVSFAWTIDGATPTESSCAGVERIAMHLDYDDGDEVEIAPIPCALDRFRYDGLPEGRATLRLIAVDPNHCVLAEGQARLDVSTALPASPSPIIALPRPAACR